MRKPRSNSRLRTSAVFGELRIDSGVLRGRQNDDDGHTNRFLGRATDQEECRDHAGHGSPIAGESQRFGSLAELGRVDHRCIAGAGCHLGPPVGQTGLGANSMTWSSSVEASDSVAWSGCRPTGSQSRGNSGTRSRITSRSDAIGRTANSASGSSAATRRPQRRGRRAAGPDCTSSGAGSRVLRACRRVQARPRQSPRRSPPPPAPRPWPASSAAARRGSPDGPQSRGGRPPTLSRTVPAAPHAPKATGSPEITHAGRSAIPRTRDDPPATARRRRAARLVQFSIDVSRQEARGKSLPQVRS